MSQCGAHGEPLWARYHALRPDDTIGATSSEWRNRQTR